MGKNKKKLVVLIPTHWEAFMGGSQYQAKVLIEHLIPMQEFEIYYLARRIKQDFKPKGYEIYKIGDPKGVGKYGFFFDGWKLLKTLNELKPDVIYHQVGCAYTGIAAYYCQKNNCNMVWHIASDIDVQKWNKKITRNIVFRYIEKKMLEYGIRRAKYIVGQTDYQGEQLEKNYGRTLSALVLNFHPFPKEIIDKSGPVTVVWIANFKRLKQPQVFVKLARSFLDIPDVQFKMIGSPPQEEDWRKDIMSEIDELNNLEYLGKLSQDEVNEQLAKSHILVNTSEYEGFSNTFIQAWMREVPVVGFNVNPDGVFDNNKLGCFSNGVYDTLVQQIKLLISDTSYREEIAARVKAFSFEHYSENNIKAFVDLFRLPGKVD